MEVKPGYKETEVGVIPEDWEVESLGQLFSFSNGVNADRGAYGQGFRFVNVLEPITYSHLHGPEITGRVTLPDSVATTYAVKRGDVLFNRTSETDTELGLAATYLGTEQIVFGGFVIRGRPVDERFDPVYSGYALRSPAIRLQIIPMGQGAIRANIGQQNLKQVIAPIPPRPEQVAIASALSDVDALLAGLDRLIAKKRDLKQAAIQQLLTGKTRLSGFHGEWEVKSLGEIGTFLKGSGVKKDQARSGHLPCIRYGEIYTHHNDYIRSFTSWISPEIAATATRLKQGDLLFAGSGETKEEIGKCVAVIEDCEAYAGGDIVILRLIDAHPMFMGYYCNTTLINAQKSSKGQGDAVVHISAAALASIQVTLPPRSEQVTIAAVLSDMDAEINALEARRDKTRALKQAMMQELLTGNIRLVQPAVTAKVETQDGTRTNIHFKRSVLAAEIISQLHNEPTFGHVKLEKMIFLVEHLCEVDTGSTYHRHAAGPYDGKALRSIDSQIKKQRWFRAEYQGKGFRYIPMDRTGDHAQYFERYFSAIREQFNGIIAKFRTFNTERCEIVATLYSAWDDLIRQGKAVSDDAILIEVLERWHESKQRIPKDRWLKALDWMRDNRLVPRGGDHTYVK